MTIELHPHHFLYIYAFVVVYLISGIIFFYREVAIEQSGLCFQDYPLRHLVAVFMYSLLWPLIWLKLLLINKK